jgi:hypothetical protein
MVGSISAHAAAEGLSLPREHIRGPCARGGFPCRYGRDLRPLAAVALAYAAPACGGVPFTSLHRPRPGKPPPRVRGPGCRRSTPQEGGGARPSRAPFPADPGIRPALHPPRLRCPHSPDRTGSASLGRLAGGGASPASVLGLFGNGAREGRSAALRVSRKASHERNPPPRRRSRIPASRGAPALCVAVAGGAGGVRPLEGARRAIPPARGWRLRCSAGSASTSK